MSVVKEWSRFETRSFSPGLAAGLRASTRETGSLGAGSLPESPGEFTLGARSYPRAAGLMPGSRGVVHRDIGAVIRRLGGRGAFEKIAMPGKGGQIPSHGHDCDDDAVG